MRNGWLLSLLLLAACTQKPPMCVDDNSLPVPAEGYVALLVVGVIGYYLGIILDEVKNRPFYLIDHTTDGSEQA